MEITPAMRAHRALRTLPRYRAWERCDEVLFAAVTEQAVLEPGETPIGFYENAAGSIELGVLFTDHGVHVYQSGSWASLPYEEMLGAEAEKSADSLSIRHRDGQTVLVPFRGGDPALGTRDTLSVLTFLRNVLADMSVGARNGRTAIKNA
jgi:hypothetical protein